MGVAEKDWALFVDYREAVGEQGPVHFAQIVGFAARMRGRDETRRRRVKHVLQAVNSDNDDTFGFFNRATKAILRNG